MSQENVEVVRRSYESYNAIGRSGDRFVDPEEVAPDLCARLARDVELHERSELPDAEVYRGREQAKEFWRKTQQLFAEIRWEPRDFTDLGHAVVVDTRVMAVGRGSGIERDRFGAHGELACALLAALRASRVKRSDTGSARSAGRRSDASTSRAWA